MYANFIECPVDLKTQSQLLKFARHLFTPNFPIPHPMMPIQRDTPRNSVRHTLLYHLEKKVVSNTSWTCLLAIVLCQAHCRLLCKLVLLGNAHPLILVMRQRALSHMLARLFCVAALGEEVIMLQYRSSTKLMAVCEP